MADHCHCCLKHHGATAHALQLVHGVGVVAGFAQRFAVEICHLIRADDNGPGMQKRYRIRFGQRQALGQRLRGFAV